MKTDKKPRKLTLATFSQCIFLTIKYFLQNRSLSFASACAFSFIFSVIPIFMMITMVLVRILHASPQTITSIFNLIPEIQQYLDTDSVINTAQSLKAVHSFEILVGLFIFWMARRFFASITDSLQNIFHSQTQRKALWNQIFTFVIEVLTVLIVCAFIFAYMSLQTISSLPIFQRIPQLSFIYNGIFSSGSIKWLPNILIFAVITSFYKTNSGTKPSLLLCIFSGLICTSSFWVFRIILNSFLNVSHYNLIYGVLGQVIILLMEVFFFFTFFLFFGQFIFTMQFFDELLLGELYLLPKIDTKGYASTIRRLLFIRPDYLLAQGVEVIALAQGEELFKTGDYGTDAYYILKGCLKLTSDENSENYTLAHRGEFLGETACVLNQLRKFTASAAIDSKIVKIDAETFRFLLHQNQEAARKVLHQITTYFD
ncbi:MAG: YihY/virulence factor BrkB family protein [Treponema sp.]|nr:YihY/virulence factor BrkB family protein [Candidatus Treponema equifaecale]